LDSYIPPGIFLTVPLIITIILLIEWTFCIGLSVGYQDAGDYQTLRKACKKSLGILISNGIGWVKLWAEAYGQESRVGSELRVNIQLLEPQASPYPPAYEVSLYLIHVSSTNVLPSS
jgi:hypothetical protein